VIRAILLLAAAYPGAVALLLVALPVVQPRDGPLALAAVLAMHLALAAVILAPLAIHRDARPLRFALVLVAVASVVRFGGEWLSVPPARAADPAGELAILSWNLELGARPGPAAVDGLRGQDVDVVVLQELGPAHAAAIEADPELRVRFPYRELVPMDGVLGMALLSAHPIISSTLVADPIAIEAVLDVRGRPVTVITAHPFPGRIGFVGPVPLSFDPVSRDADLARFRTRVDAAIGRGETVVIAGDFNTTPSEPAFERLVAGLADAHAEVGLGPGWTWRPSRLEGLGVGLLRIDLALAGPGARPVAVGERCELPGDHCQLEARFILD
jgi:endonuclease/exonuclease/phosphatase (EEP) superfamily protein YafD